MRFWHALMVTFHPITTFDANSLVIFSNIRYQVVCILIGQADCRYKSISAIFLHILLIGNFGACALELIQLSTHYQPPHWSWVSESAYIYILTA